ncbi:MAG: hypothetical protein HRU35_07105 [Rickettsiaceae bacterium]|nr:hypothetical protein [Rickettsiaceae bacterium]
MKSKKIEKETSSDITRDKVSNKQIQELFREGNLIARALYSSEFKSKKNNIGFDFKDFQDEISFLNKEKLDGNYKNIVKEIEVLPYLYQM